MAYGLLVTGTSNNIQIDSDQPYAYHKLVASGTATTVTGLTGLDTSKDLIFAKPDGGLNSLHANVSPPSKITFSQIADYYILRPVSSESPSSQTYGLRVYNADGQLAFDSGVFSSGQDVILQIVTVVDPGTLRGDVSSSSSIAYTGTDYQTVYGCLNKSSYQTGQYFLNGFSWVSPSTVRYSSVISLGIFGNGYFRNQTLLLAKVAIP